MMKEFKYECAQTQPKVANLSIVIECAMFKVIFCLNKAEKIHVA